MIEDSGYETISAHFSKEGAIKAIERYKKERKKSILKDKEFDKEIRDNIIEYEERFTHWTYKELEVLP